MAAPPFIDTNILLYAGSNAPADAPKKRIACALLGELDFCLSSQVVQEYLSNALNKKSLGISTTQIEKLLESLQDVTVLAVSYLLILDAWKLRSAFKSLPLGFHHHRRRTMSRLRDPLLGGHEPWPKLRWRTRHQSVSIESADTPVCAANESVHPRHFRSR